MLRVQLASDVSSVCCLRLVRVVNAFGGEPSARVPCGFGIPAVGGTAASGLLIEGEPGIGKTTLWLSAVEQARDSAYRVFSARVGQAESVLAYAGQTSSATLTPPSSPSCPTCSASPSTGVLLRASSEDHTTDQRAVAAASAAVFDRLAADSPVVIAIDDLQWLDRSSKDLVAFAARRFKGRVGLLVTGQMQKAGTR